jgi:hypothetical protein
MADSNVEKSTPPVDFEKEVRVMTLPSAILEACSLIPNLHPIRPRPGVWVCPVCRNVK